MGAAAEVFALGVALNILLGPGVEGAVVLPNRPKVEGVLEEVAIDVNAN